MLLGKTLACHVYLSTVFSQKIVQAGDVTASYKQLSPVDFYKIRLKLLPEIRGHTIVGLAKIFHNSINWMCTFSMGINENNKLPNFRSSRLL